MQESGLGVMDTPQLRDVDGWRQGRWQRVTEVCFGGTDGVLWRRITCSM